MKRLALCMVLMVGILVVGCDTFSDLVPGLQGVQTEITQLRQDLLDLETFGDPADQEIAAKSRERLLVLEKWVDTAKAEVEERGSEKFDLWGLADMGLEIGTYAGVPGLGVLSLVLNAFRRKANKATETVVRGVEIARNGGTEINWEQLALVHERAGVSETVRAIRKKHKAELETASLATGVEKKAKVAA